MSGQAWVWVLLSLLAAERLAELWIARRNQRWMGARGAREHARSFSRLLFVFHGLWLFSFAVEAWAFARRPLIAPEWVFALFLLLQGLRYWCILSLGYFWNTKIIVLPGAPLVRKGPYRWLRHPNYRVVMLELYLYPALFGCWFSAFVFGTANLWMLKKRVEQEEAALASI